MQRRKLGEENVEEIQKIEEMRKRGIFPSSIGGFIEALHANQTGALSVLWGIANKSHLLMGCLKISHC